jgi:hypothetical protein
VGVKIATNRKKNPCEFLISAACRKYKEHCRRHSAGRRLSRYVAYVVQVHKVMRVTFGSWNIVVGREMDGQGLNPGRKNRSFCSLTTYRWALGAA